MKIVNEIIYLLDHEKENWTEMNALDGPLLIYKEMAIVLEIPRLYSCSSSIGIRSNSVIYNLGLPGLLDRWRLMRAVRRFLNNLSIGDLKRYDDVLLERLNGKAN
jgi:hypothetical protein